MPSLDNMFCKIFTKNLKELLKLPALVTHVQASAYNEKSM